jgi:hypothetical protein
MPNQPVISNPGTVFGDRGHLRQDGRMGLAGHRQGAELAGLDVWQRTHRLVLGLLSDE